MDITTKSSNLPENLDAKFADTILISGWLIGKAEKTKTTYKKVIRTFFEYHPRISVATATTAHVTTFLRAAEKRGARPSTLNLYLNALASLFSFAVKQRKIEQDPAAGLKNYRLQNTIYQKTLDLFEIEQMILKTKRQRDVLLIKMLFYLGLRVGEVTEILVSDFIFRKDGVLLNVKGKGSKIRQTPIDENLWGLITDYIEVQSLRMSDYLFSDEKEKSRRLSTFAIWRAVRSAAKRAKLNPMPSPHWFRHTCATMSLEGGAPIHVVKERLGHASLSTTQIYLHAKASEGLSQYLPKLGSSED